MLEIEKTYLVKELPENLDIYPHQELIDLYIPDTSDHPKLRLRKQGNKKELTKKTLISEQDASRQREQTISLSDEEYNHLAKLPAKRIHKVRYEIPYQGYTLEIDVFKDNLEGLILCDVEFSSETEKDSFIPPFFCRADMTQETWLAGGMLCGKEYKDIEENIRKL